MTLDAKQKSGQTIHPNQIYGDDEQCRETAASPRPATKADNQYRTLFDASPISLWEEDFSEIKEYLDRLRQTGVTDFGAYFDERPQDVLYCLDMLVIRDVNQATLQMYKAADKQALLARLPEILREETYTLFREELICLAQGQTTYEGEAINYTLEGEKLHVLVRWSVPDNNQERWSQVIVSILDITKQKQAEEALRLQATALESAANAIVITERSGKIIWVNPAFTNLTGYTAEEVLGKNPKLLKSGLNDPALYKDLWRTIMTGNVWVCDELVNRRKNGTYYFERMTITPVKNSAGKVIRFVAIKEDITERKQIENQLRQELQEEELLRQIVAINPTPNQLAESLNLICEKLAGFYSVPSVSVALVDRNAMFVDLVGGYQTAETVGRVVSLANILPIEALVEQLNILFVADLKQAAQFVHLQDFIQAFDNQASLVLPFELAGSQNGLLLLDSNQPLQLNENDIQFVEQISLHLSQMIQRVQAEQALQRQRDFAYQVMNSMGQGLFVLSEMGTIEFCNPAFAQLLGRDEAVLVGRSIADLGRFKLGARVQELDFAHTNGRLIHTLVTAVTQANAQAIGSVCVVTDLTAQKKIENALAQARDEALATTRLKSEFLANMSHEIRTPLNAVIGMTGLVLDTPLDAEQRDYIETIHSSGELLLRLINDILDFSKIEAGKLMLEKRPFSVRTSILEAIGMVSSKASAKGLALVHVIDSQVPDTVVGDETRVRQVLLNLLSNAVKFTDEGEVLLSVTQQAANPTTLKFCVQDTGIGIVPDRSDRLFQSFSQIDTSATRKYGGTGLGLAISKQLVELMGGQIWVESALGQGSVFCFTLVVDRAFNAPGKTVHSPEASLPQEAAVGALPASGAPLAAVHPLRILVAEDNRVNQKVVARMLQRLGYEADIVNNGQEAVAALAERPYHLILMDVQMPQMDGVAATQHIRQNWLPTKQPKIIALTAHALAGDREKYLQAGMDEYISKPLHIQTLKAILAKLFPTSAP